MYLSLSVKCWKILIRGAILWPATVQTIHCNTKNAFSCIQQCGHAVSTDSNSFTGRTAFGMANSGTAEQAETFVYDRHSFRDAYRF